MKPAATEIYATDSVSVVYDTDRDMYVFTFFASGVVYRYKRSHIFEHLIEEILSDTQEQPVRCT